MQIDISVQPQYGLSSGCFVALMPPWSEEERIAFARKHSDAGVFEQSLLREYEFMRWAVAAVNIISTVPTYDFYTVHLPSRLYTLTERILVAKVLLSDEIYDKEPRYYVAHPDIITDFGVWRQLGARLLIENMDNRKSIGSTVQQLADIFKELPEAGLCFDVGHAVQANPDPVGGLALAIALHDRIKCLHLSYVDAAGQHNRLRDADANTQEYLGALYRRVYASGTGQIIESPLQSAEDVVTEKEAWAQLLKKA